VADEARSDLSSQVNERRDNHKQLLEDLDTILERVSLIWQRIGKIASCVYKKLLLDPVLS
jgi:hypothetical protein